MPILKPKFQSFRNLDKLQHTNTLIQVPKPSQISQSLKLTNANST